MSQYNQAFHLELYHQRILHRTTKFLINQVIQRNNNNNIQDTRIHSIILNNLVIHMHRDKCIKVNPNPGRLLFKIQLSFNQVHFCLVFAIFISFYHARSYGGCNTSCWAYANNDPMPTMSAIRCDKSWSRDFWHDSLLGTYALLNRVSEANLCVSDNLHR